MHSSQIDEAYVGTITSKEQWESWDKYIDILVQTDNNNQEVKGDNQESTGPDIASQQKSKQ